MTLFSILALMSAGATLPSQGTARLCGEICIMKQSIENIQNMMSGSRSERRHAYVEKIPFDIHYREYATCYVESVDADTFEENSSDANIDLRLQKAFDDCAIARNSGDTKFLSAINKVREKWDNPSNKLVARDSMRSLFILTVLGKSMNDQTGPRFERYLRSALPELDRQNNAPNQ